MTREVLVASILADADRPLLGREIVLRSNGRIGRGTVYVYLAELVDRGVVRRLDGSNFPWPCTPRYLLNVESSK